MQNWKKHYIKTSIHCITFHLNINTWKSETTFWKLNQIQSKTDFKETLLEWQKDVHNWANWSVISLLNDLLGRVLVMTGMAVPATAFTVDSAVSKVYFIKRFVSFVWLYRLPSWPMAVVTRGRLPMRLKNCSWVSPTSAMSNRCFSCWLWRYIRHCQRKTNTDATRLTQYANLAPIFLAGDQIIGIYMCQENGQCNHNFHDVNECKCNTHKYS